jgi:transcription-repair coupling factor (superfamily II helicase)
MSRRSFEKLSRTSNMPCQINYFKRLIKKSLRFSIVELSVKPIFRIAHKFDIQPQPSFNKQFDLAEQFE